jgi:flavin-dependent dehydrogenase
MADSAAEVLRYDVVVLGGALAGGATALLLRRRHPELRVLVIEKNAAFSWKVGESTVEVSAYFLSRVLRLWDHLSREQVPKHGLRYWFHHGGVQTPREASEVGANQLPRLPGFQLDRAKLDEHVLKTAADAGAELWRPAKVVELSLPEENGGAESVLRVERDGRTVEVRAGWVVDASGRSAVIARRRGWLKPLEEHPTSAVWARFRGLRDFDSPEFAGDPDDSFSSWSVASRRLATNHFNGYGYWIWFIPLHGGETSVGAVWDSRMVQPEGTSAEEKLNWFLQGNPLTRECIKGAAPIEGDLWSYNYLPYLNDKVAGRGWSAVGDAAGFLDPFYSPGIDQIAYSVSWSVELIRRHADHPDPMEFAAMLEEHNQRYRNYLYGIFKTIYKDKYALLGDFDTMITAFLLDTSFYYLFVVIPIHRRGTPKLLKPPFYPRYSEYAVQVIRFYQARLVAIARRKLKLGIYGDHNAGRRPRFPGFSLRWGTWGMLLAGLRRWLFLELANAWTYIVRPRPSKAGMPGPMRVPGSAPAVAPVPEWGDSAPPTRTPAGP